MKPIRDLGSKKYLRRGVCLALIVGAVPACRQNTSDGSTDGLTPEGIQSSADANATASQFAGPAAGNSSATQQQTGASSTGRGPAISFEGRIDTVTNPQTPSMGWASSRLRIGFVGTKLGVKLAALSANGTQRQGALSDNYLSISVDQNTPRVVQLQYGTQSYPLADGLPRGQHEVTLTKLTEGEFGSIQLIGTSTDGALSDTAPSPIRRLEVVGDSGATGWGAQGSLGDAKVCATSAGAQNAAVAFPAIASKLLNAQLHNTSYAGKGLVQNRDVENDAYKTMPRLWTRRLPQSPFSGDDTKDVGAWDPKEWVPDAVILVTSGNDFYANGGPSQNTFQNTVSSFIKVLRTYYPAVEIYIMVSPMLHNIADANEGYSPTARTDAIAWCRATIASLNDAHAHYVDVPEDTGERGLSCDYHMTPATHQTVAKTLATAIAADLKW